MAFRFHFDPEMLHSVAGGHSAIDIPRLNLQTEDEARSFLTCYGFDLTIAGEEDKLWYYHRRALVLLTERLGFAEKDIPEVLRDRKQLQEIWKLLIFASSRNPEERLLQRWACAIIRSMHVFVHAESDLFSFFAGDIQAQILGPFQQAVFNDGTDHRPVLKSTKEGRNPIELVGFEVKPFKTSQSTVIKLLAKPDALAMKVFDKLGLRFVTHSPFDTFRVIRFLVEENILSFPHIMPDQSSNNLYPVDLFVKVCDELEKMSPPPSEDQIQALLEKRLHDSGLDAKFFRKVNEQSDQNFRFIKFISRRLVQVAPMAGKDPFSFFYPYEVQIMDQSAHQSILSGPSEHSAYKERQRIAARKRLFPDEVAP